MFSSSLLFTVSLLILINESLSCKAVRREPEYRITDVKILRKNERELTNLILRTSVRFGKDLNVSLSQRRSWNPYTGSIPGDYGSSVIVERLDNGLWDSEYDFLVKISSDKSGDQNFLIIDKQVHEISDTRNVEEFYEIFRAHKKD